MKNAIPQMKRHKIHCMLSKKNDFNPLESYFPRGKCQSMEYDKKNHKVERKVHEHKICDINKLQSQDYM